MCFLAAGTAALLTDEDHHQIITVNTVIFVTIPGHRRPHRRNFEALVITGGSKSSSSPRRRPSRSISSRSISNSSRSRKCARRNNDNLPHFPAVNGGDADRIGSNAAAAAAAAAAASAAVEAAATVPAV